MSVLQAVALGIIQGVTEFLPISSDGHLALAYHFFGMTPDLAFEVFLHIATLIALVSYFWRDLLVLASSVLPRNKHMAAERKTVVWIAVGTVVSAIVALAIGPYVELAAASLVFVGLGFLLTAAFLTAAELLVDRVRHIDDSSELGWLRSLGIGLLQGAAVLPGVSRSGSTIAAGVTSGLSREAAARYSFLLGFPIITLAAAKDAVDIAQGTAHLPGLLPSIAGFIAAAIAGYLAIWWLLPFLKRHRLWGFAAYTGVLGTVILVLGLVGRG